MSHIPSLPDDPELLKQMIRELLEQLQSSRRHEEQLRFKLDLLTRKLFGRKSEKLDPNQLSLIDLEALGVPKTESPEIPELPAEEPAAPRRQPKRRRPSKELPRRRVEHTLSEAERLCPCCNIPMQPFREELHEQLDYRPAVLEVIEHVRYVYACTRGCDEAVETAAKPPQLIEKGLPGPGLLAHVVTCKYGDHLPLNRLEGIFRRLGASIARSTLCDWVRACAEAASPVVDALKTQALSSHVLATDDTSVCVLDAQQGSKKGRLWVYVGDEQHPVTVYDYTPTRAGEGPQTFLEGYSGFLQADAYSAYDALYQTGRITELGCWMHCRRYFYEASQKDSGLPFEALAMIRELYKVERECEKLAPDRRFERRRERSLKILDAFDQWIDSKAPAILPKSPLGKAFTYYINQRAALRRYCDDGRFPIDNGRSERALRPIAVGRNNWLFAGSDAGGQRAAILYSLIATCRRHKIDPFRYLTDLFRQLPEHPRNQVHELTPLAWKQRLTTA